MTYAPCRRGAFTLVEALIVTALIAVLASLALPALSRARDAARATRCAMHVRQLHLAWTLYAADHRDRAVPLAYWSIEDIGDGEQIFWFGSHGTRSTPPDPTRGFLAPYLDGPRLGQGSVFECPAQPWGSYRPQGPHRSSTTTYGYNGYYLSPAKTPGWGETIGFRPWRRLADIERPSELLVFADTLLATDTHVSNTALLDPPMLFTGTVWSENPYPTTAFRHARRASTLRADGSAALMRAHGPASALSPILVSSVTDQPGPWYVPDWTRWR